MFKGVSRQRLFSINSVLVLCLIVLAFLYLWRLGSAPAGLSSTEASARANAGSIHQIANRPLFLPHLITQYVVLKTAHATVLLLRLVSTIYALVFILCFYKIVRNWFGLVVGVMGTIIFMTTPLVINVARSATPEVMLLSPLILIAAYFWFRRTEKNKDFAFVVLTVFCASSLYIPLMILLIPTAAIVTWSTLKVDINRVRKPMMILGIALGLILVIPLIRAPIIHPYLIKELFAIPIAWHGPKEQIISLGWAVSDVFWHTRTHNPLFIAVLPIVNISQIVLSFFGGYAMWRQARREFMWLAGIFLLGIVAAGVSGSPIFLLIAYIPIAILVCAGLRYLYIEWRTIFPLNPLPRALALFLMTFLVAANVAYGIRYSLIAWPKTEETRKSYVLK